MIFPVILGNFLVLCDKRKKLLRKQEVHDLISVDAHHRRVYAELFGQEAAFLERERLLDFRFHFGPKQVVPPHFQLDSPFVPVRKEMRKHLGDVPSGTDPVYGLMVEHVLPHGLDAPIPSIDLGADVRPLEFELLD